MTDGYQAARPTRRRGVALAVLAGIGLAACGGGSGAAEPPRDETPTTAIEVDGQLDLDDGGPMMAASPEVRAEALDAADPTTGPDAEAAADIACVAIAHSLLTPVDPALVRPPTPGDQQSDLDVIADEGPEDVRAVAQTVLDALPWLNGYDPAAGDVPTADQQVAATDILDGLDALIAWSGDTCALEGVFWGCAAPQGIVPGGTATGSDELVSLSPEGALSGDPETAVEVARAHDQVIFAWTDESGMGLRAEVAAAGADGTWRSGGDLACP